jgi:[acyl-carrier-protein] S-malonyltransferase
MGVPWRQHPAWKVVDLVADATGRDLESLLIDADAATLKATRNAQLAAFGLSVVILEAARTDGGLDDAQVRAVAGHSLGEYTALVAAGALTPEEGARLVDARGEAMQVATDAEPGTMAAILGLDTPLVVEACQAVEGAWPANDNAPGQVVIAGTSEGVAAAGEAARERGAKRVVPLPVGGAFHSPLMVPAQDRLDAALAAAVFGTARYDVVANVDATTHRDGWVALLSAQLVSPVRWRESLLSLASLGVTHFLELGPGTELSGMVKRTLDDSTWANVATPDDLPALGGFLTAAGLG